MSPWEILGIEPSNDIRAIKRAYSIKLKTTRPDDDAAAYQALREAYEFALWWVKQGFADSQAEVPESTESAESDLIQNSETKASEAGLSLSEAEIPELQTKADPVEAESVSEKEAAHPELPDQGPSLDRLLLTCAAVLEQGGEVHFLRLWPELLKQLEDLPISVHSEASRGFANFVLQQEVPVEVLVALTRYFQWGLDYRADAQLGAQLAYSLQATLQRLHVYAALNGTPDDADTYPLALANLFDQGRKGWMRLLAMCLDYDVRQLAMQCDPNRLRALGATKIAGQAAVEAVSRGAIWQVILLFFVFVSCTYWLDAFSSAQGGLIHHYFVGFWTTVLLVFNFYLYSEFPELDQWWPSVRKWFDDLDWKLFRRILLPIFLLLPVALGKEWIALDEVDLLIPLSLLCFGFWLLLSTDERPWRKLFLPVGVVLYLGLSELLPEWSTTALVSLAFFWVSLAHIVLTKYPIRFELIYESVVKFGLLRERPFLFLAIKFIALAWIACVLISLPALIFRLAARGGPVFASLAIFGGAMLSGPLRPVSGTSWLLMWTAGAVISIQCIQWALGQFAEFLLRRFSV